MKLATRAVHAGQHPEPVTGAIMTPIFQTATFAQDAIAQHKGYEYARTQNPTREILEANLASLEGGAHGHAFASGLAAVTGLAMLMEAGDHLVCTSNLYGGTYRLLTTILAGFGLRATFVDTSDLGAVEEAIEGRTRLVFVESPTNPILTLTDLGAIAGLAKEHGIWSCVDNTFMSPIFQRPLEHGIDIVLHSTTKYLNGHSDVVGGVIITDDDSLSERLAHVQNTAGAVPSPFDSWLVLRGVKTLHLRMQAHDSHGRRIAEFLDADSRVGRVYYPGLVDHPQHRLAEEQMDGFGGMISFALDGFDAAERFVAALRVFTLAESLGGVESLVCHPGAMTHASVPEEERIALGIVPGLIRLSVGIEDVEDLIEDLDKALSAT
ncbi:MAG: cystathionine gamma-synthase [Gemmatimonadetes bacterium]|nr:cystathionine gamma-synthase [Gemmatimonadota bacterium]